MLNTLSNLHDTDGVQRGMNVLYEKINDALEVQPLPINCDDISKSLLDLKTKFNQRTVKRDDLTKLFSEIANKRNELCKKILKTYYEPVEHNDPISYFTVYERYNLNRIAEVKPYDIGNKCAYNKDGYDCKINTYTKFPPNIKVLGERRDAFIKKFPNDIKDTVDVELDKFLNETSKEYIPPDKKTYPLTGDYSFEIKTVPGKNKVNELIDGETYYEYNENDGIKLLGKLTKREETVTNDDWGGRSIDKRYKFNFESKKDIDETSCSMLRLYKLLPVQGGRRTRCRNARKTRRSKTKRRRSNRKAKRSHCRR